MESLESYGLEYNRRTKTYVIFKETEHFPAYVKNVGVHNEKLELIY